MRVALSILMLFAIAVALALLAGNNQGTITLFWPPYRVDLSLNLVLLLLLGIFVTLHVALRALAALFAMPREARRWRLQHKERALHVALLDSLSHLVAGRFIRARKSAELVLVLTIAVLGMVVGLTAVRDSISQELVDLSDAFGAVNQTYNVVGISKAKSSGKAHAAVAGFGFNDKADDCDCQGLTITDVCGKQDSSNGAANEGNQ